MEELLRRHEVSTVYLILNTEGQVAYFLETARKGVARDIFLARRASIQVGVRVRLAGGGPGCSSPGWERVYSLYHGPFARFGVGSGEELREAVLKLRDAGFEKVGFHFYPGTNIVSLDLLRELYRRFAQAVKEVIAQTGVELGFLDLGGGFGIDYSTGAPAPLNELAAMWQEVFRPLLEGPETILVEPGRTIIGPAGVLLVKVVDRDERSGRQHIMIDAGLSHFGRTYVYGQAHRIVALRDGGSRDDSGTVETVVSGCTMASGDFFAGDPIAGVWARLPPLEVGDVLAILDVGAYGFCMSSHFSGQLRPPEVLLLDDGAAVLIRHRERPTALQSEVPECPESL